MDEILGQERALEAVEFGIGIRQKGFNLFVLGPPGLGKQTMVRSSAPAPQGSRRARG